MNCAWLILPMLGQRLSSSSSPFLNTGSDLLPACCCSRNIRFTSDVSDSQRRKQPSKLSQKTWISCIFKGAGEVTVQINISKSSPSPWLVVADHRGLDWQDSFTLFRNGCCYNFKGMLPFTRLPFHTRNSLKWAEMRINRAAIIIRSTPSPQTVSSRIIR